VRQICGNSAQFAEIEAFLGTAMNVRKFLIPVLALVVLFGASIVAQPALAQSCISPGTGTGPGNPPVFIACPTSRPSSSSGGYGQFQQDILIGNVGTITQTVRDQIHRRLMGTSTIATPLRFTGEDPEFDNSNPFAAMGVTDPFNALAYGKVYTKAPPMAPASQWIYGANLIGSGDQTTTFGTQIGIGTVTGAFDVTKIGIFNTNDALTFIGTASGSWAHDFSGPLSEWDSDTPAVSGTLSYLNGAFSADFTALASWTSYSSGLGGLPTNNSVISYTGNAQYRFDLPYSVFFEPTGGVTYTDAFSSGFGTEAADYTELHAGARVGTEMKWMGYTIEPQLSGAVFKVVDYNVDNAILAPSIIPANPNLGLGGRGSAKITVLWTSNFSSYIEAHTSAISGTNTALGITGMQTTGGQVGMRYTW
jgi:hypothetical protein